MSIRKSDISPIKLGYFQSLPTGIYKEGKPYFSPYKRGQN
jgi:hypothetical protein